MFIISNEIRIAVFGFLLSGGPGVSRGPSTESGSVGQKKHLYSLQRLPPHLPHHPFKLP